MFGTVMVFKNKLRLVHQGVSNDDAINLLCTLHRWAQLEALLLGVDPPPRSNVVLVLNTLFKLDKEHSQEDAFSLLCGLLATPGYPMANRLRCVAVSFGALKIEPAERLPELFRPVMKLALSPAAPFFVHMMEDYLKIMVNGTANMRTRAADNMRTIESNLHFTALGKYNFERMGMFTVITSKHMESISNMANGKEEEEEDEARV